MPPFPRLDDARLRRAWPWLFGMVAFGIAAAKLTRTYADLGIYLDVGREWLAGGHDLCRPRADSGPWVYPPVAAMPFALLDACCGERGARWVYSASLGIATALLLRALVQIMAPFGGLAWWRWLVFGVLFQRCIAQNLTHGQLSLWVGALVTIGIAALQRGRDGRAGLALGAAAALKVTPIVFVLALPFFGRTRAAVATAATAAMLVLLLPWPWCGTAEHLRHLGDFVRAASGSVTAPETAAIVQSYAGPSISGAFDYALQPRPLDREGHTVNLLSVGDRTLTVVKVVWSVGLLALLGVWMRRARSADVAQRLAQQCAAVTLAMSMFAPLLRTYHLAAALVPAVLFCRGPRAGRDVLFVTTALLLLLTLTARQKSLLGETLWRFLDGGLALHVAWVLVIVWNVRAANEQRAGLQHSPRILARGAANVVPREASGS